MSRGLIIGIAVIGVLLMSMGMIPDYFGLFEDVVDDTDDEALGNGVTLANDTVGVDNITVAGDSSTMSVYEGYVNEDGQYVIPDETTGGTLQSIYYGNVLITNFFVLPVLTIYYAVNDGTTSTAPVEVESVSVDYKMSLDRVGVTDGQGPIMYVEDTNLEFAASDYFETISKPLIDVNGGELETTDLLSLAGRLDLTGDVLTGDEIQGLLEDYVFSLGFSLAEGSSYTIQLAFILSDLVIHYTLSDGESGIYEAEFDFTNIITLGMVIPIVAPPPDPDPDPTTPIRTLDPITGVGVAFNIFWSEGGDGTINYVMVFAGAAVLLLGGYWYKKKGLSVNIGKSLRGKRK